MMGDAHDSLMPVDVAIMYEKQKKTLDLGTLSIDKMDRHTKYQPCNFNS